MIGTSSDRSGRVVTANSTRRVGFGFGPARLSLSLFGPRDGGVCSTSGAAALLTMIRQYRAAGCSKNMSIWTFHRKRKLICRTTF